MPDFEDIKKKITDVADATKAAASELVEKAAPVAGNAFETVKDVASGLVEKAAPVAGSTFEAVKGAAGDLAEKAAPVANSALEGAKAKIGDAGKLLKNKAEELTGLDIDRDGKIGEGEPAAEPEDKGEGGGAF